MLVDSQRGHFCAVSGIGMLAMRARSVIEPGLIVPAPLPPCGCGSGGGAGMIGSCGAGREALL